MQISQLISPGRLIGDRWMNDWMNFSTTTTKMNEIQWKKVEGGKKRWQITKYLTHTHSWYLVAVIQFDTPSSLISKIQSKKEWNLNFFFPRLSVPLSLCLLLLLRYEKNQKNLDGGMINAVNRSLDAFRLSPVGVGFASLCDCYGHRTLHALSFPFHFCRLPTENLFADQHIYALNSAVVHQQIWNIQSEPVKLKLSWVILIWSRNTSIGNKIPTTHFFYSLA